MAEPDLPELRLADWRPTRDVLWTYARWLGAIRRHLTPPARHWGHASLGLGLRGLTTGPMGLGSSRIELAIDLVAGEVALSVSGGSDWRSPLGKAGWADILDRVRRAAAAGAASSPLDVSQTAEMTSQGYDPEAGRQYWQALSRIGAVFNHFSGKLRGEVHGPQLWPHHFDLAVLWLTGRLVTGQDPADEAYADENMNFGFSTGDDGIPEAYFYATAYPAVEHFAVDGLPAGARQNTTGWHGVRLDYAWLISRPDPVESLGEFLERVQLSGAEALGARADFPASGALTRASK